MPNGNMRRLWGENMVDIIVAGATGLTGGLLVPMLVEAGHKVTIITRREVPGLNAGVEQIIADGDKWPSELAGRSFDIGISCLGTTIKKAGSQEAFRGVDFALLRDFASAAKQAGVRQFLSVSSTMADSSAKSFYLKTKGDAEDALRSTGFDRLDIIRPGLLKGPRQEFRLGEQIGIWLSPLMDHLLRGKMRKFRSIQAANVAGAMAVLTNHDDAGIFVHHNSDLNALASQ